jgi:hypothetical protein
MAFNHWKKGEPMITAQDILASLTANEKRIQAELKAEDWHRFCRELVSLQEGFRQVAL